MSIPESKPRQMINPMWMDWRKAVVYHHHMIDQYSNTVSVNGQKWLDKMIAYHKRSLVELEDCKPQRLVPR